MSTKLSSGARLRPGPLEPAFVESAQDRHRQLDLDLDGRPDLRGTAKEVVRALEAVSVARLPSFRASSSIRSQRAKLSRIPWRNSIGDTATANFVRIEHPATCGATARPDVSKVLGAKARSAPGASGRA